MAIMASLHCNEFVYPNHASIAWPIIQFWGSWLGTVKRKRREADRKLVAGCYLSDRRRKVNPPGPCTCRTPRAAALHPPRSRDPIWLDQWRPVRQRACS